MGLPDKPHPPPLVHSKGESSSSVDYQASLGDEGGNSSIKNSIKDILTDNSQRSVRRTHSDVGEVFLKAEPSQACETSPRTYQRQYSSPQPLKTRPLNRVPNHCSGAWHRMRSLKRSKGSAHLRRSVSQPLDLDKSFENAMPDSRYQSLSNNTPNKRCRRPSSGDILNDSNTSDDEGGASDSEDFRKDHRRGLEEEEDGIIYAEALWDHVTLDSEELVFKVGDLITVIDSSDKDWWWGHISNREGWFPASFVRLLVNQEDHQESTAEEDDIKLRWPGRKLSFPGLTYEQVRANVINEIISSERDFVKHLTDVVEGYLKQIRKRPDMFTEECISTIFGNMEQLYAFQSSFLKELEDCIKWDEPHVSCIGACFISNRQKFEIYSEYCNNHPSAVSELQALYQHQKYIHFFEACRLLQEMIDISLDGFLLTPVQKICKYPLQLQELLKYTKSDHPDYANVHGALEAMRDVAQLVNERKRRMECLEKIASWQMAVEGWEGPDLIEDSSQLIHQGEVTKISGGSWSKDVTLYLFDHQMVYCKKDLLKRNTYVYRGRINLDMCEVSDIQEGKDFGRNAALHQAWKVHCLDRNKTYIFSSKGEAEKQRWLEAFRRERLLVQEDKSIGFNVSEKAKQLAKVAARSHKQRPKRPRRMWFSFGGHKKVRGTGRTLGQGQPHPL